MLLNGIFKSPKALGCGNAPIHLMEHKHGTIEIDMLSYTRKACLQPQLRHSLLLQIRTPVYVITTRISLNFAISMCEQGDVGISLSYDKIWSFIPRIHVCSLLQILITR